MYFFIELHKVQPSQLYINRDKLESVRTWLDAQTHNYDSIPVKEYNGEIVFTDGHTRALVLYEQNASKVKVHWDKELLDDALYLECMRWCKLEEITHISDLRSRILPKHKYESHWIEKCHQYKVSLNELK